MLCELIITLLDLQDGGDSVLGVTWFAWSVLSLIWDDSRWNLTSPLSLLGVLYGSFWRNYGRHYRRLRFFQSVQREPSQRPLFLAVPSCLHRVCDLCCRFQHLAESSAVGL